MNSRSNGGTEPDGKTPAAFVGNEAAVTLIKVVRSFRQGERSVAAVAGVSLTVAPGEMVTLMGPSGCGKSTTLNLIAGVDRPDSGMVWVAGVDVGAADEAALVAFRRSNIGVVFQAFNLMPHLTVEENIALPLTLAGIHDRTRVLDLIERVGLGHRRRHSPAELSGGEQQRTAVARALVHHPAVVVADEPTGNLDSVSGNAVLALLDELRRSEGTAVLLATHDDRVAARADRTLVMRDGRLSR